MLICVSDEPDREQRVPLQSINKCHHNPRFQSFTSCLNWDWGDKWDVQDKGNK